MPAFSGEEKVPERKLGEATNCWFPATHAPLTPRPPASFSVQPSFASRSFRDQHAFLQMEIFFEQNVSRKEKG